MSTDKGLTHHDCRVLVGSSMGKEVFEAFVLLSRSVGFLPWPSMVLEGSFLPDSFQLLHVMPQGVLNHSKWLGHKCFSNH